jgi:hypothetical protein
MGCVIPRVIPRISKQNVKAALREIDQGREPVPSNRRSTGWCFVAENGRHYPPKYLLSRAVFYKTGKELGPFNAGAQTRRRLDEAKCGRVERDKRKRLPDCQNHINFSN